MTFRALIQAGILALLVGATPAIPQDSGDRQRQIASHLGQAQTFLKANRPDLAAGEFTAILRLDPGNSEAHANLGVLLFFQGDYVKAAPQLSAAVEARPELWKLQALLGMCERRIGQTGTAQAHLEKAFPHLEDEKLRIQTGMELIEIYYGADELDKAAQVVGILRLIRPDDVDILYSSHRIYSRLAGEALLGVVMLAPASARMQELIGDEMARQGETKSAILHYREALKIDPRLPGVRFEIGELLSDSTPPADPLEIEREYRAALEVNPFDENSLCGLGDIVLRQSDLKRALALYSRAVQLQPSDASANLGLAKVMLAMNKPTEAEPLLERAAKLDPLNATTRYHLATLYRRLGRTADATREMAEFERLKKLKERITELYRGMRLQPARREQLDPDVP